MPFVLIVQEVECLKRGGLTLFAVRFFFRLIIRCCLIFHAESFKVELASPAALSVQTIKHRLDSAHPRRSSLLWEPRSAHHVSISSKVALHFLFFFIPPARTRLCGCESEFSPFISDRPFRRSGSVSKRSHVEITPRPRLQWHTKHTGVQHPRPHPPHHRLSK